MFACRTIGHKLTCDTLALEPPNYHSSGTTALVGRIKTNKSFNCFIALNMIRKGWQNPQGLFIGELRAQTFVFNFSNPSHQKKKKNTRICPMAYYGIPPLSQHLAPISSGGRIKFHSLSLLDTNSWSPT